MALITNFECTEMARNTKHSPIDANYTVFEHDKETLLQINTYGNKERKNPRSVSQTIQLNRSSAKALYTILKKTFDF